MSQLLQFDHIDPATREAILEFINRAPFPEYLTPDWWLPLERAGREGPGRPVHGSIDADIARRTLAWRDTQPGGQLALLEQLTGVAGFGQPQVDLLAETLSDAAIHRNRVELCVDGPACREVLLETIASARNYLHLCSFLFFNDEIGHEVAQALVEKAGQGVEVRVLMDKTASGFTLMEPPELKRKKYRYQIGELHSRLINGGVKVVDMQPIERPPGEMEALRQKGVPEAWLAEQEEMNRAIWYTLAGWNHVDHRKLVIADGRRALVMSMGVGNEYMYADGGGPGKGDGHYQEPRWHDAITVIDGGAAVRVNRLFARRWIFSGGDYFLFDEPFYAPPAEPVGQDTVTILTSHPGDVCETWLDTMFDHYCQKNSLRNLYAFDLLRVARKEVWIQNPYVLDRFIFRAWEKLLRLKPMVKFNLIRPLSRLNEYPGNSIPALRPMLKRIFRRGDSRLIKAGARILEYHRAFNHIKIALVDDWLATHGSYNLNYRSAKKDLELNVVVESRSYARQVKERVFDVDVNYCRVVKPGIAERAVSSALLRLGDLAVMDFIFPEVG